LTGKELRAFTVDEIVAMVKAGDRPDVIIARLEAGGASYPLPASELVRLGNAGVPNEVLDYLQATYLRDVRREERWLASHPWWGGHPGFGWRPYLYYYRGRPYWVTR
jgi:hypothetical protein